MATIREIIAAVDALKLVMAEVDALQVQKDGLQVEKDAVQARLDMVNAQLVDKRADQAVKMAALKAML